MRPGEGGAAEPGHLSEYITKWGAVWVERDKISRALSPSWWAGAAKLPYSPVKRARTAVTVDKRMKTMSERLEVK